MLAVGDLSAHHTTAHDEAIDDVCSSMAEIHDHTEDDDMKVFVSRLPKKWDDDTLAEQFAAVFGP